MVFWMLAGLVGLGLLAMLAWPLLRPVARQPEVQDLALYRGQLAEVERDAARGLLAPDEATRIRTEVARRLLGAEGEGGAAVARDLPRNLMLALVAGAILAGLAIYWQLGAPGYPDYGIARRVEFSQALRAARPSQAAAEALAAERGGLPEVSAGAAALLAARRAAATAAPGDAGALTLLAAAEVSAGNFAAARSAQEQAVGLRGDAATAGELAALTAYMALAAGREVTPEAEAVALRTLAQAPDDPTARYFLGLMHVQTARPDLAFPLWRALLEESPEGTPYIPWVRDRIGALAAAAGVRYQPPDAAAAADQAAMIRGMVEGLAERLAAEGGPVEDWARLILSLGVLGETERAQAIWAEAQGVFAQDAPGLAALAEAAAKGGLGE